jgi:RNA-binding protein
MSLSPAQKKFLRSLGHSLKPIVTVGSAGVTPAVTAELDASLAHHELVKIKVRSGERSSRREMVTSLCEATGSELVQQIGHMALLYRPDPESPSIRLPPR